MKVVQVHNLLDFVLQIDLHGTEQEARVKLDPNKISVNSVAASEIALLC